MTNEKRYCMCISSAPKASEKAGQRAALFSASQWAQGTAIQIGFLEGDTDLQDRVRNAAAEWVAPGMANLTFRWVDPSIADVRIAFKPGDGSWSYLGTQCMRINPPEPTMNFGWLKPDSDDEELRQVVLHEFGHMLGLIHEHQNPDGGIDWDRDAVIEDLSGPPNNWDADTIEHNIFKQYADGEVDTTSVDRDSIMMYPIPLKWTKDDFETWFNSELSATDRAFITAKYR